MSLILGRRIGESIIVRAEDDFCVKKGETLFEFMVLGINGYQVRIGTTADAKYNIMRDELIDREKSDE